jgi:hypothetical protein
MTTWYNPANNLKLLGTRVDRTTSNLAQTGNLTLFTVATGRVVITAIVGEVTTAIQAQANAVKLTSVSTTGSIATDLCATVDVNGAAVGNLFGIAGGSSVAAVLGSAVPQPNETVMQPGVIRMTAAASNTGQMKWTVFYYPLDAGATLVAS